jgi:hypothetical protein
MLRQHISLAMTAKKESGRSTRRFLSYGGAALVGMGGIFVLASFALPNLLAVSYSNAASAIGTTTAPGLPPPPPLDKALYDRMLLGLAHVATTSPWYYAFLQGTTTITMPGATTSVTVAKKSWPVRAAYPADGRALLPFNRIVAYYGNFYSKGMGVLGQYPEAEMLDKLLTAAAMWRAADPDTPVIPAIHYIAIVAQGSAGKDGKYRARMPDAQVDHALELAHKIKGLVFLDLQVGLSNIQSELPIYADYFKLPEVHLGIDPEFAMQTSGARPGRVIGTFDADDINYTIQYLSNVVRENNLPPKILVVHRFTHDMVTNFKKIKPTPEVEVVMDMDGWGDQAKKIGTYTNVVASEPVQFTGFKLFYKNDILPPSTGMLKPDQVLKLTPAPLYIQYQ